MTQHHSMNTGKALKFLVKALSSIVFTVILDGGYPSLIWTSFAKPRLLKLLVSLFLIKFLSESMFHGRLHICLFMDYPIVDRRYHPRHSAKQVKFP